MNNGYQIIINKSHVKDKLFAFWSVKECFFIVMVTFIPIFILSKFISELYSMCIGASLGFVLAVMYIELPDGLSVIDHIKMFKKYNKSTKEYYNISIQEKGDLYYVTKK